MTRFCTIGLVSLLLCAGGCEREPRTSGGYSQQGPAKSPSNAVQSVAAADDAGSQKLFVNQSFEDALADAGKQNKLVFIDFYTTWCAPCKKLDKTTWTDPKVIAWLHEKTIPLKIDAEQQKKLAERYGVTAFPTMVFVGADGERVASFSGYKTADEFIARAAAELEG